MDKHVKNQVFYITNPAYEEMYAIMSDEKTNYSNRTEQGNHDEIDGGQQQD